jgi:hypothetical protein
MKRRPGYGGGVSPHVKRSSFVARWSAWVVRVVLGTVLRNGTLRALASVFGWRR